jgi:hypothetical protein
MSKQLHKNFTDCQVKSFLKSYLDREIKMNYILQMLKIKRNRFFELLAKYRKRTKMRKGFNQSKRCTD